MKFTDNIGALDKAAARDDSRLGITAVHLDVEHKRLVATDGIMMVVAPCEPEKGDTTGLISLEAIALARKLVAASKFNHGGAISFKASKQVTIIDHIQNRTYVFERPSGKFPAYSKVFPTVVDPQPTVCFSLTKLKILVDALGGEFASSNKSKSICIWATGEGKPLVVKAHPDGPLGILMPVTFDKKANWRRTIKALAEMEKERKADEKAIEKKRKATPVVEMPSNDALAASYAEEIKEAIQE